MKNKSEKIWMDGKLTNWEDAKIHVLAHTLHYGGGVFEGIRCYEARDGRRLIFKLGEHVRRMFNGCKILHMDVPFSENDIKNGCIDVIKHNNLRNCYLRPIVYMGEGEMGVFADNPTRVSIAAWDWGAYLGNGALENGVKVHVSSFNRHHVNVGMVQGKICGQYVSSYLAKKEAVKKGFHEAIMLDTNGYVAEATGENVFAVSDNEVFTPPFSSPILNGLTRKAIIEIAKDMGLTVRQEPFTRDFMYICDEIFFTGTAAEITPVVELDHRKIGDGKPGPLTKKIQKLFFDIVRGENMKYKKWLTYVD